MATLFTQVCNRVQVFTLSTYSFCLLLLSLILLLPVNHYCCKLIMLLLIDSTFIVSVICNATSFFMGHLLLSYPSYFFLLLFFFLFSRTIIIMLTMGERADGRTVGGTMCMSKRFSVDIKNIHKNESMCAVCLFFMCTREQCIRVEKEEKRAYNEHD